MICAKLKKNPPSKKEEPFENEGLQAFFKREGNNIEYLVSFYLIYEIKRQELYSDREEAMCQFFVSANIEHLNPYDLENLFQHTYIYIDNIFN